MLLEISAHAPRDGDIHLANSWCCSDCIHTCSAVSDRHTAHFAALALLARLFYLSLLVKSSPDAGTPGPVMFAASMHSCVVKAGSRATPPGRLQLTKRRERSIARCQLVHLR